MSPLDRNRAETIAIAVTLALKERKAMELYNAAGVYPGISLDGA